jgi:acetyl esterase/lipase
LLLWYPKLFAAAWAPLLALAGGLGAVLSLGRSRRLTGRDYMGLGAGLFGVAVATRHSIRAAATPANFEEAFGPGWQARLPRRVVPSTSDRRRLRRQRNVVYATHPATGERLLADLWLPPAGVEPTGLAVIYIFGGAWHFMDKDLLTQHIMQQVAGQGHLVMNVNYTLAPRAQLPGMVADVKRAIGWLKTNGFRYGVNEERIVLMGCSSGAHMALLAAYTPNHPAFQPAEVEADTSVRAVISDSGFADLVDTHTLFRDRFGGYLREKLPPERWFLEIMGWLFRRAGLLPPGGRIVVPQKMVPSLLGGTPDEVPERYRLGSPLSHVGPHCPPTLLLQGAHDYTGILPQARRLHQVLRQAGVPVVYAEFPEAEHSFYVVSMGAARWAPAIRAAARHTERFLAQMV